MNNSCLALGYLCVKARDDAYYSDMWSVCQVVFVCVYVSVHALSVGVFPLVLHKCVHIHFCE